MVVVRAISQSTEMDKVVREWGLDWWWLLFLVYEAVIRDSRYESDYGKGGVRWGLVEMFDLVLYGLGYI